MTGEQRPLGRYVVRGTVVGAAVGVGALVLVTLLWLGVNVYLESQKPSPGVPDLVSPPFFAALYFLVYAVPAAAVGAILGLVWWSVARALAAIARLR